MISSSKQYNDADGATDEIALLAKLCRRQSRYHDVLRIAGKYALTEIAPSVRPAAGRDVFGSMCCENAIFHM